LWEKIRDMHLTRTELERHGNLGQMNNKDGMKIEILFKEKSKT
jgi:hypothetical protein